MALAGGCSKQGKALPKANSGRAAFEPFEPYGTAARARAFIGAAPRLRAPRWEPPKEPEPRCRRSPRSAPAASTRARQRPSSASPARRSRSPPPRASAERRAKAEPARRRVIATMAQDGLFTKLHLSVTARTRPGQAVLVSGSATADRTAGALEMVPAPERRRRAGVAASLGTHSSAAKTIERGSSVSPKLVARRSPAQTSGPSGGRPSPSSSPRARATTTATC